MKNTKTTTKTNKKISIRRAVIITGATSGIGLAFTEGYLKGDGAPADYQVVVMVARNPKKMKQIEADLKAKFMKSNSQKTIPEIQTVTTDLSLPESVQTVMNHITKNQLHVTAFINNAGVGYMGNLMDMSSEKITELINLNITTLTHFTQTVGKHMEEWVQTIRPNENPVIVNVASVAGLMPLPLMSVYAASKAYVINFSEALRRECQNAINQRGYGIEVYTLCPGSTRTSFFERAGKQIEMNPPSKILSTEYFMDPTEVSQAVYIAIKKKQFFIVPGLPNQFFSYLAKLLPRWLASKLSYQFMKKRMGKS